MKVGIFIDGETVFKGLKNKRLDFKSFKAWLAQDDNVAILGYFNCLHITDKKKKFIKTLSDLGYTLFLREPLYNYFEDKFMKHGLEIELAIESISRKDDFDKYILVSGKHNFLPVCEKLAMEGKDVEVVGYKNSTNNVFEKYNIRYIDDYFNMEKK